MAGPAIARGPALVLLAILGIGAFLTGLELMVTAVALPAIVEDLASWTELRKASWIINAYLLTTVVVMPVAGRLSDRWGVRRPFLAALGVFALGSTLAGAAQSLDQLIAARVLQAVGGGFLVPVATAATSHLFPGSGRPRALGVIGAVTFLGMAAGPFVGSTVLAAVHPADVLASAGLPAPVLDVLDSPWRYVFYLNLPIAVASLGLAWAAFGEWDTERGSTSVDLLGAMLVTVGLAAILIGLTLAGSRQVEGLDVDPWLAVAGLVGVGLLVALAGLALGRVRRGPFLDPRWFRSPAFTSAVIVSALTGYAFATAIIGGAVFVDRVLYGGPDSQRLALGALALATAVGALGSGLVLRAVGLRITTLVGIGLGLVGLWRMSAWATTSSLAEVATSLAVFGLGFGLTVTPRSTAAVEALGREAYGIASAIVTVAREVGMAVGLAVLTAFGSTVIDRLSSEVYATPDAYKAFIPVALRSRPLRDGLVVQALESWVSSEAATILVGIFLVAAAVLAIAILPTLALGGRERDGSASGAGSGEDARDDGDELEPTFAG